MTTKSNTKFTSNHPNHVLDKRIMIINVIVLIIAYQYLLVIETKNANLHLYALTIGWLILTACQSVWGYFRTRGKWFEYIVHLQWHLCIVVAQEFLYKV